MIANYHTHTYRCCHAEGDVRDYVEEAAKRGLSILGMADHTPYDFYDQGPRERRIRMTPEELPGYADSVRALAEEYRGKVEIHLGVEAEYYPKYFPRLMELLRGSSVEYMILGQHFLGNEVEGLYCGIPTEDAEALKRYVDQSIEGLKTGLFTYFAHPDLFRYIGSDEIYVREMGRLCRAARETETPLEVNLLGIWERRHYPDERFWKVAALEGNEVILGCDAHQPQRVTDPESETKAIRMAERLGLKLIGQVPLRRLDR